MLTFLKHLSFLSITRRSGFNLSLCLLPELYICLLEKSRQMPRAAPKTGNCAKIRKRECASLGVEGAKSFCEVIPPNAARAVQPSAIYVLVVHSCAEAEGGRPLIGLSVRTPSLTTPHTLGLSTIQQLKECTRHTLSYFI